MIGRTLSRMDGRLRYGRCWWCGEPDSLFRLEGARLAGSPELPLPSTIQSPAERDSFRVCPRCAMTFGYARMAHDAELWEAGIRATAGPTLEDVEREAAAAQRRIWDRIQRAIRDEHRRTGDAATE